MLGYLEQNYGIAAYYKELTDALKAVRWTITGVKSDESLHASQLMVHKNVIEHVLKIIGSSADEFADDILNAHVEVSRMFDALVRELEKAKEVVKYLPR